MRIFCKLGLHVWRTLNGTPLAGKGCYCLNCWEVREPYEASKEHIDAVMEALAEDDKYQ